MIWNYAIGHCLLMLFAGTFTGFVEGFAKARGVMNFSIWSKRISGVLIALVGGWFVWQGGVFFANTVASNINITCIQPCNFSKKKKSGQLTSTAFFS